MTTNSRQMKSATRLYAVQALFQMEAGNLSSEDVRKEFLSHRFGETIDGDVDLFEVLLNAAVTHQAKIDQLTDRALTDNWPINRIDPTLRALFRAAGAELITGKTPPKVTINEFVDVAKAFFPEGKEAKFVNGVLDHIARDARPDAFT